MGETRKFFTTPRIAPRPFVNFSSIINFLSISGKSIEDFVLGKRILSQGVLALSDASLQRRGISRVGLGLVCRLHLRAHRVGRDVLLVFVDDGAAKRALQNGDERQDKSRANFNQTEFCLIVVGALLFDRVGGLFGDLVVAEPDLVVNYAEGQDVVDKGFGLAGLWGNAKCLKIC